MCVGEHVQVEVPAEPQRTGHVQGEPFTLCSSQGCFPGSQGRLSGSQGYFSGSQGRFPGSQASSSARPSLLELSTYWRACQVMLIPIASHDVHALRRIWDTDLEGR